MSVDRPGAYDTPSGPDDVPVDVSDAARAAFSAHDPQVVLADLVRDSLDDEGADPAARALEFSVGDHVVTVRLLAAQAGSSSRVAVCVDPVPDGQLLLDTRSEQPLAVVTREGSGCWSFSPAPTGPVSFVVSDRGARLRTAWTRF